MTEKMTVQGLVRVATIMATIAREPLNVGGGYRFK